MQGFDLAREALIASDIESENEINNYSAKINTLYQKIKSEILVSNDETKTAQTLFNWLWKTKPNRYRSRGSYKLNEVIDAQLAPGLGPVGNCLGLTILYNILAQKFGLKIKTIWMEEAFGITPHVFSVLHSEQRIIEIENIFPSGFDFKEYLDNPHREEWGDEELVVDIYNSKFNQG